MSRLPAWAFVLGLLFFVLGTAMSATALYRVAHQLALDTGAAGLDLPGVSELVAISGSRATASTVPAATATRAIPNTVVAVVSSPVATARAHLHYGARSVGFQLGRPAAASPSY